MADLFKRRAAVWRTERSRTVLVTGCVPKRIPLFLFPSWCALSTAFRSNLLFTANKWLIKRPKIDLYLWFRLIFDTRNRFFALFIIVVLRFRLISHKERYFGCHGTFPDHLPKTVLRIYFLNWTQFHLLKTTWYNIFN